MEVKPLYLGMNSDQRGAIAVFVSSYLRSPYETFLILPDAAVRDEVKHNLVENGIPIFGASVCTLNELAGHYFSSLNSTEIQIDQYDIELILYKLLEENQSQLPSFRGAWESIQSMVPELRAFLEALCDFKVDYPRCLGDLKSARSEQLALIGGLYAEILSSSHLVDRCGMLEWVTREITENANFHIGRVIFYGLYEPKPIEKDFIKAIIDKAEEAEYHIPYDAGSRAFKDDGSWLNSSVIVEHMKASLEEPRASIFSNPPKSHLGRVAKGIFRDPLDEVRSVASKIKELIGSGAEPKSIAVIMPMRSKLAPLVKEVFDDCGIPYSIFLDVPLSESPLVTSIFSILDAVLSDYDRDVIIRLINSPFFTFKINLDGAKTHLIGSEIDQLSIEAGIIRGKDEWLPAIDSLATQIAGEMDDSEDRSKLRLRLKLERAERTKECISQLFAELSALEGQQAVQERVDILKSLLQRFEIAQNLEKDDEAIREREVRALSSFMSVLNSMEMGEAIAPSGKMDLREFVSRLRMLVSVKGFRESPENRNAVQVTGLRSSYLLRHDHVFIIGMVDGDIPYLAAGNAFIREREVRKMGLLTSEDLLRHERYYFLSALMSSNVRTYISRAESNGSDMLVPSYFFDELEAAFDIDTFGGEPDGSSALCCHRRIGEMISRKREAEQVKANLSVTLDELCRRIAVECDERAGGYSSVYDGVFADPAIIGELSNVLSRHNAFSPSRLESYARCPFTFYLESVLDIKPRPEVEEDLTPGDKGTLFHRIAGRFYSELRSEGSTRFTEAQLDLMTERILRIGQEELGRYDLDGPAWEAFRSTVMGFGARKGLLRAFLENEAKNRSAFEPKFFELSFGSPLDDGFDASSWEEPAAIDLGEEELKLRGRIDRVDVLPDGRFAVIDYKTGRSTPSVAEIEQGTALQIPLYVQAVESLIPDMRGIGGAYYGVRSEAEIDHKCVFGDKEHENDLKPYFGERRRYREDFQAIIQRSNEHVRSHLEGMRAGRFHPNTGPAKCPRSCQYSTICRADGSRSEGEDDAD